MLRDEFQKKIESFCMKEHLIEAGEKIVVGVSGGADSVCLLLVLSELGYELTAVHVNHGIRKEAEEDEAYVENFCKERKIPCVTIHADVPEEAVTRKVSEEEAGRMVRYEALERVRIERGAQKIALAHHRDDQAETVLWNLFRGTGTTGLAGIPVKRDIVIRPLLCMSRAEVEGYLKQRGITWQTDATNLTCDYTRNRIRNVLLPMVEEDINDQASAHIAELASDMQEVQQFLDSQVELAVRRCVEQSVPSKIERVVCEPEDGIHGERSEESPCKTDNRLYEGTGESYRYLVRKAPWQQEEEDIIRHLLLKRVLTDCAQAARDISRVHVRALEELMERQVGREIHLPYGCVARRVYEGVELRQLRDVSTTGRAECALKSETDRNICASHSTRSISQNEERNTRKSPEEAGESPESSIGRLIFEVIEPNPRCKAENPFTKCFDYDIINYYPILRTRRPGDYIVINEKGGRQKLKQFMIDRKIPSEERGSIPLVALEDEILWIVGHRMSERGKVTDSTRRVLRITYQP